MVYMMLMFGGPAATTLEHRDVEPGGRQARVLGVALKGSVSLPLVSDLLGPVWRIAYMPLTR